jgi:23S rRNA (adenine2030-N6)-methyltransferase
MRYRHAFHAGNFADVHKHILLLQLLLAMQKKVKGLHYLETHAGAGLYDLASADARHSEESDSGILRLDAATKADTTRLHAAIRHYLDAVDRTRREQGNARAYPGSPGLVAANLRPVDSATFIELDSAISRALDRALQSIGAQASATPKISVRNADGYQIVAAQLPPPSRRGLIFLDPPYEERAEEQHVAAALTAGLLRFETGVFAVWYPIKKRHDSDLVLERLARGLTRPTLSLEFCRHPPDHTAGLNGSGMLVINPPWEIVTGASAWQVQLEQLLGATGGSRVRWLVPENPA